MVGCVPGEEQARPATLLSAPAAVESQGQEAASAPEGVPADEQQVAQAEPARELEPEPLEADAHAYPEWNGYDLDCPDVGRMVRVSGDDPHGLDRDGDGWGCEKYGR
jgi:hypothetical protein